MTTGKKTFFLQPPFQQSTSSQQDDYKDLLEDQVDFPASDTILFKAPGLKKKLKKIQAEKREADSAQKNELQKAEATKFKIESENLTKKVEELKKIELEAKAKTTALEAIKSDSLKAEREKEKIFLELKQRAEKASNPGLFLNHALKPRVIKPTVNYEGQNWITAVFVILFFLVIVSKRAYSKKIKLLFQSFIGIAPQNSREEFSIPGRLKITLWIIFILSSSLFLFKLFRGINIKEVSFYSHYPFFAITTFLTLICLGQIMAVYFLSYIFDAGRETSDHINHIQSFYFLTGLFLFPVSILIFYNSQIPVSFLIYSGMVIFLIGYAFRIIRGFFNGFLNPNISTFHLFLYLCTLEILPILVMCKIFIPSV